MPTYEYKCQECGVRFDCFQHFSDDPLETCPECEGRVHRVIHPVGIVFKGKGFYVTDNRANNSAGTPKGETSTSKESTSEAAADAPKGDAATAEPKSTKTKDEAE